MPLPWTPALLPEALPAAALAGTAAGLLGGLLAAGLQGRLPPRGTARAACLGAFAVLLAVGVDAGIRGLPDARAHVQLTDVRPAPEREALATVQLEPSDAAKGASWLYVLAWQGGGDSHRVVDRLRRVGEGVYRSTKPIPLYGSWKAGLRLQTGRLRGAVPLRLPPDPALPETAGAELPAPAAFTRRFVDDSLIVLRETKRDVPGWLWGAAIALIGLAYAIFITGIALAVARLGRRGGERTSRVSPGARAPRARPDPRARPPSPLPRRGVRDPA
jgi:hypothetical protein